MDLLRTGVVESRQSALLNSAARAAQAHRSAHLAEAAAAQTPQSLGRCRERSSPFGVQRAYDIQGNMCEVDEGAYRAAHGGSGQATGLRREPS